MKKKGGLLQGASLKPARCLLFFRVVPWADSEASEPTCIRDRKLKKLRFMDRQATLQCDWPESRLKKNQAKSLRPCRQRIMFRVPGEKRTLGTCNFFLFTTVQSPPGALMELSMEISAFSCVGGHLL